MRCEGTLKLAPGLLELAPPPHSRRSVSTARAAGAAGSCALPWAGAVHAEAAAPVLDLSARALRPMHMALERHWDCDSGVLSGPAPRQGVKRGVVGGQRGGRGHH